MVGWRLGEITTGNGSGFLRDDEAVGFGHRFLLSLVKKATAFLRPPARRFSSEVRPWRSLASVAA